MLKRLFLASLFGALIMGGAQAACSEDSIETISSDGDLIVLSSGKSYDVDAGDTSTSATWQENEDVLVCGDTIVNKDESGEKVGVTPH